MVVENLKRVKVEGIHIFFQKTFYFRGRTTVNVLGQYILSNPYVVQLALDLACTVGVHSAELAVPCMLAEQVYNYIRVAKQELTALL